MKTKTLSSLLKIFVLIAAVCGWFLCLFAVPFFGKNIIRSYPEFSSWYWPWLLFAWLVALPCFALLVYIWRISNCVKNETVFTWKTAKLVRAGVVLLLSDASLLFAGNLFLLLLNMNHPSVVLMSAVIAVFETVIALFAEIVSRYLTKAVVLQEESDGTL